MALLELIAVVGVIAVATAAIVGTAKYTNNQRVIGNQVENAGVIVDRVVKASMASGHFATLNQANALRDGLFPPSMLDEVGNPRAWKGGVALTGVPVAGVPSFGAALTFDKVPGHACVKFVSQAAPGFYSIKVNDQLVKDKFEALDIPLLTRSCEPATSRVQFVYAKNGGTGLPPPGAPIPPPPIPCTPKASTTETVVDTACPAGWLGTRVFETRYTCFPETGQTIAQKPTLMSDTCQPACVLPLPHQQVDRQLRTAYRSPACSAGQAGVLTQARREERTRSRTAMCAPSPGYSAPVGNFSWTPYTVWSTWTGAGAWSVVSSSCGQACVLPSPSTETKTKQWVIEQTLTCPAGQVGAGIRKRKTFKQPLARKASCPMPASSFTWSGWNATGPVVESNWATVSTNCAPACIAPPIQRTPTTRAAPQDVRVEPCDPGFSGTITYRRNQRENGFTGTSYHCPQPSGNYTAQAYTEWLGTFYPTSAWTFTKACSTVCVPPAASTAPATRNIRSERERIECFDGAPGHIIQERFWVEYGTRKTTWSCPAANRGADPHYTYTWSGTFGYSKWMYVDFQCDFEGQK
ncbi:type 4 pilus major pilin [Novilysobacter arseniciresistens]|uniref:type 4 pilus major pilin n=1 Tax=Novilysobacter arseniciresistens TaxID=1385522 RepID=UPI00126A3750|nr:type 4 pilus major pilin [Lysobacter arseniciresistens]